MLTKNQYKVLKVNSVNYKKKRCEKLKILHFNFCIFLLL